MKKVSFFLIFKLLALSYAFGKTESNVRVQISFAEQWSLMQSEYQQLSFSAKKYDWLDYCHPIWQDTRSEIQSLLTGSVNKKILHELVMKCMMVRADFSKMQEYEICYLQDCVSTETKTMLRQFSETDFSSLPRECSEFNCNINTLGQLFYLAKILEYTKQTYPQTIVEFGGGYGCLARITKQVLSDATIIIIDLPELIALQSLFLRNTMNDTPVFVHKEIPSSFAKGAIHLVPVYLLKNLSLETDLFISAFALSESSEIIQSLIGDTKKFFNARYLYLTGQINGWGASFKFCAHKKIFECTRSHYKTVYSQPFHLFASDLPSYEIFASR
jgi:putative sugar O-methyltransferase